LSFLNFSIRNPGVGIKQGGFPLKKAGMTREVKFVIPEFFYQESRGVVKIRWIPVKRLRE